ncbi:DNA repair protein RecN [Jejudonia soesokkakensis]|uniref:DNA repair protein RecN n=1 Tax=Jejudonia soesokkakensis TaxID=1323432 RepID=A0ABW2N0W8_9FLAO
MITFLSIKNYALIEDIRVDLNAGMTIITGETGAGKSILLGALSLLLGKRADISSVKDASKKCIIEAEFSLGGYQLESIFAENDLDYESDTIVRREILPSGKSRAFVNDTPVSVAQLQALGIHLVDIHSQHETLALTDTAYQMEVVDALAGNKLLLQEYSTQWRNFLKASERLSALKNQKAEATKELDFNTFLHTELTEANLKGTDQEALEETYEQLTNAEEITETLSQVAQLLSEDQIGTLQTSKEARQSLGKLRTYSKQFEELWERINSVIIELEDIESSVETVAETMEADPKEIAVLNEKLQTLYTLQKKHNVATVEELLEIEARLSEKIEVTLHIDSEIEKLEKEVASEKEKTRTTGKKIEESRAIAIPKLKQQLETILGELGLPNARFQFDLKPSETFRKNGINDLELLFTANKGLAFGSLKKVASGGEMSRIMLAVKAVLSRYKKLPTIIFDEIDTGVSGEIAHKMAEIMSEMSATMQLLSITHLPQIAAKGEHHLKIYKEDVNEATQTRLQTLNEEQRIVEIAQMIGGKNVSDAAIANAKELLN